MRFEDTFGTNPEQVTELGRIYCDSLQTTEGSRDGWGKDSVCAMAKHWPGGGPCEGGRDAHYAFGKYAVYPGENFKEHLKPFTEGVFHLEGPTGYASATVICSRFWRHTNSAVKSTGKRLCVSGWNSRLCAC